MVYKDCETCKNYGSCGCDALREREYLRRKGKTATKTIV